MANLLGYLKNKDNDKLFLENYDTGWILISNLQNGAKYRNDNNKPYYRKIGNIVYLKGVFQSGTEGTQFVLPKGFRPNTPYASFIVRHGSSTCIAYINTDSIDGVFVLQNSVLNAETSLNNISFPVD